jgi:hypothetical protein
MQPVMMDDTWRIKKSHGVIEKSNDQPCLCRLKWLFPHGLWSKPTAVPGVHPFGFYLGARCLIQTARVSLRCVQRKKRKTPSLISASVLFFRWALRRTGRAPPPFDWPSQRNCGRAPTKHQVCTPPSLPFQMYEPSTPNPNWSYLYSDLTLLTSILCPKNIKIKISCTPMSYVCSAPDLKYQLLVSILCAWFHI